MRTKLKTAVIHIRSIQTKVDENLSILFLRTWITCRDFVKTFFLQETSKRFTKISKSLIDVFSH